MLAALFKNRQINARTCVCPSILREMSGKSSSSSVLQEEAVVRLMHKTPGTPIKYNYQISPKKLESKRSLFQSNSPGNSDDLGLMSPLSASSCSSVNSMESPHFSPNGQFCTPPKTPTSDGTPRKNSLRLTAKKIQVKSSLFPDLKVPTPKSRCTPNTRRSLFSKILTPQSKDSFDELEEELRSLSTPSTSRKARRCDTLENNSVVDESDSSQVSSQETEESIKVSDKPTALGIKTLTCENFYGSMPKASPPSAKTKLFIDTLEPKSRGREMVRSLSKDSLGFNRSFVSGGSRKQSKTQRSKSRGRSRSSHGDRHRPPHVGVWHNIKKPKQMKKMKKERPLISPETRILKTIKSPNKKEIKVKSKPLFQEHTKKWTSLGKKRSRKDLEDENIIDSFPDHLIKRKKLPMLRSNAHSALDETKLKSSENLTPDPKKKFLKYGQTRKATFTITENMKLQIFHGSMRLQTPKKRRKLYSGKRDFIEDFNDFDDGDNNMCEKIQGILNTLHSEKESSAQAKSNLLGENVYDAPIFHTTGSEKKALTLSPLKVQRSPLKTVSNLPTMILNDFDSDSNDESLVFSKEGSTQEKKFSEVSLAKTGDMVFHLTNFLVNKDIEPSPSKMDNLKEGTENSPPKEEKLYSLFYKQNWNKNSNTNENLNAKIQSKKKIIVPDDQYLLDAGQKSIGIVTCKKCGVMYQAGDFADEATHINFHNHLPELRFPGWNNERVVGRFSDGRVIMILSTDPKVWWQKVLKIVDIVDQDLGFSEASVQSLFYKTVYLYINDKAKQVVGCLIAEENGVAYRMFPPMEGVEIDSCSKDPSPCKVGISRIWTALSHRRKGVASRMIECLQKTFFFGNIVSLDQIAFSAPSPMGKLFAQKVTGRLDFLVYGFA